MDELNSAQTTLPNQSISNTTSTPFPQNSKKTTYIIIAASLILVLIIAGFVYFFTRPDSEKTANDYVVNGEFDFDACMREYRPPAGFTGGINDYCYGLKNQYNLSKTTTPSVSGTIASSATPIATQSGQSCTTPAPALTDARGQFKANPFDISNIKIVTIGKDTGDPRFVYPWVKEGKVNIYAPADGVLFKIRHKVFVIDGLNGNDYDMFFQVDCGTVYRFNHITDPRADIKATYPAGDLASGDYANGGLDIPERVIPKVNIKVKAGESLGSTSGTPVAHDFDFAVGVAAQAPNAGDPFSVCPFSVFNEPMKSNLLALLGPKNGSPTPGYVCDIPSQKF
jgi:hypothetical protein